MQVRVLEGKRTFRQRPFGKDVSAKKLDTVISWFRFWFSTNWLGVAVDRSNFSGRKDRGRAFWSNCRDRMECGRILSYLLYGSVASLPSPSSNIEAWPYGTSLRFASLLHSGTRGMWTGKWSLGLMPFGLRSFGLIQLVTWLYFLC